MNYLVSKIKRDHNKQAALIIFAVLVLLFSKTIFTSKINSASDILQIWPTFTIKHAYTPQNVLFSDPMTQFEPWYRFAADSVRLLHIPLWNPYQGNGTPYLGAMQTAFFYPLGWFVFLLGFKYGLLFLYLFKLFFIGFFMYLFLKEIKINHKASILGALAFMFSGYNIVWLYWPHSSVVFFLPLSLVLIEKIIKREIFPYWLLYSISLAIALFGGHPETFAHIFLVNMLYFPFRLICEQSYRHEKLIMLFTFSKSVFLGILLASVQLLPFLEYLVNSDVFYARTFKENPFFLHPAMSLLNFVPDLLGNQSFSGYFATFTNYNESASGYIGLTIAFFALLSILVFYKKKIIIFFSLLAAFSLSIVYKVPIIFKLFTLLPVFSKSANHRMLFLFSFSLAVVSSYLLSDVLDRKIAITPRKYVLFWLLYLIVIVAFCAGSVIHFFDFIDSHKAYINYLKKVSVLYFIDFGLVLLLILPITKHRFIFLSFFIVVLFETGVHAFVYEPTIDSNLFFPKTLLINFVTRNTGNYRVVSVSDLAYFGPNMGTFYKVNDVKNYDAMLLRDYKHVFDTFVKSVTNWQAIRHVDKGYLDMSGVKYIIASDESELVQKLSLSSEEIGNYPVSFEGTGYKVFENKHVLPRAFFANLSVSNKELLTANDVTSSVNDVSIEEYSSEKITIHAHTNKKSLLVLTDSFFPGWNVYIDGSKGYIEKLRSSFRGVPVDEGSHEIIFKYEPISYMLGAILSAIAALFVLVQVLQYIVLLRDRKPRDKPIHLQLL